jgi:hypothetical protein
MKDTKEYNYETIIFLINDPNINIKYKESSSLDPQRYKNSVLKQMNDKVIEILGENNDVYLVPSDKIAMIKIKSNN